MECEEEVPSDEEGTIGVGQHGGRGGAAAEA